MLHRTRRESVSHEVVYRRGAGEEAAEITVLATVSSSRTERFDERGSIVVRYRDFCIAAADLVIDEVAIEPREGDVIIETNGEVAERFEVVKAGTDPCFRREGLQNESIRVHTVKVGVES